MFDINYYYKAKNAIDAVNYLHNNVGAICIAGGTDVLVRLRELHPGYDHLVDINNLPDLKSIEMLSNGTISIGAGASFNDLMESEIIKKHVPMLANAAATVAGPQIRSAGTIGGNLCNGAVSADLAAPVLAFNASLCILGVDGQRIIPANGFHTGPGKVALKADEILLSVNIALEDWQGYSGHYIKYAMREAMDIATIGCAAALKMDANKIAGVRLAYIVSAPVPLRCVAAEAALLGQELNAKTIAAAQIAIMNDVKPRTSWRATAEFRTHIIKTLVQRVLEEAANQVVA